MSVFNLRKRIIVPNQHPWGYYGAKALHWTPFEMGNGILAWFDAASEDTFTFSAGNAVSQWRDKSEDENHLDANSSPIYVPKALNGLGTTRWSNNRMSFVSEHDFRNKTIYLVAKQTGTGGQIFSSFGVNIHFRFTTNNNIFVTGWGGMTTSGAPANVFNIYRFVGATTGGSFYINGVLNVTGSTQGSAARYNQMGVRYSSSEPLYGDIPEVLMTTTALGSEDLIEGYLAHKWGLTDNLLYSHPYKKVPPLITR